MIRGKLPTIFDRLSPESYRSVALDGYGPAMPQCRLNPTASSPVGIAMSTLATAPTTGARPVSQPETVDEPGMGRLELFPLAAEEATLFAFVKHVFETYWESVFFG